MDRDFAHLHLHSEFSALDAISRVDDIAETVAGHGQPAVAVTDHGSLAGAWQFAHACQRWGVKPIIGIEFYLAVGGRTERNTETASDGKRRTNYHLTVLAESPQGWGNLVELHNASWQPDAYWYKPRIDLGLLEQHAAGLIVLTGCLGGPVAAHLADGNPDRAHAAVDDLASAVGKDRLYVEVMDHGFDRETATLKSLVELAGQHRLPLVATNDAHYCHPGQADAHDAWLAVGTKAKLADPDRFAFHGSGYHITDTQWMRARFDSQPGTERACDATLEIAERCADWVLPDARPRLPSFNPPQGWQPSAHAGTLGPSEGLLYDQVVAGATSRYGTPLPDHVKTRLRTEFDTVTGAGLADYFLIVADMIGWARDNNIRVGPGRGSSAGSLLAYTLGITGVDPLAHGLLFERFLNPGRVSMPDIDVDVTRAGQQQVFDYLAGRWGADNVARLGTFVFARTRHAIRSAARVLGTAKAGDRLAGLVPDDTGGKPYEFTRLDDTCDAASGAFRQAVADSSDAAAIVGLARGWEGVVAAQSIHACGVVVADEPLAGTVPVRIEDGQRVTCWDADAAEDAGFLKLDVLGLRTLDIMSETVRQAATVDAETPSAGEVDSPPMDPAADREAARAWDLICAGDTAAVFQLESDGIAALCMQVAPSTLDELAAILALYRPGPMSTGLHTLYAERKHGRAAVDYSRFTRDRDEAAVIATVLDDTYAVPVYQEQLMRLADVVAGFDPPQRNQLQKAVSKKDAQQMRDAGEQFIAGATAADQGKMRFAESTAANLWEAIKGAADYAFNKSHALAYAQLSYTTAWLKANWPGPFAAACLSATDNPDKRQMLLRTLTGSNVTVCPPDVNTSEAATRAVDNHTVTLGVGEIKGVKSNAEQIIAERDRNGAFTSLADLAGRVRDNTNGRWMPISVIDALIDAGACDQFGPRQGQRAVLKTLREHPNMPVPQVEWATVERSARQRHRLGIVVDGHPLEVLHDWFSRIDPIDGLWPASVTACDSAADGDRLTVIALVASWAERSYSKGRMANVTLEGPNGSFTGVIWDETLAAYHHRYPREPYEGEPVEAQLTVNVRTAETSDETTGETSTVKRRELTINSLQPVPAPHDGWEHLHAIDDGQATASS